MTTPYDQFIRFLVTKGVYDLTELNSILEEQALFPVKQDSLDAQDSLIRSLCPPGLVSQIENKSYSVDFMSWMRVLEVEEFWKAEKAFLDTNVRPLVKLTYDINQDAQLRLVITALLLKGIKHAEIAQTVGVKYSALVKEDHVRLYEKYFFNPKRMTRKDWKAHLAKCDDRSEHTYFLALTETADVLKTELELPSKISVSDTLQYLLSKSYQKAKQYLNIQTPEAGKEAREWIEQVVLLTDKYEKHRSADATDFLKSLQMEFDFVDTEFAAPDPSILKDLAAKSLSPIEAKEIGDKNES